MPLRLQKDLGLDPAAVLPLQQEQQKVRLEPRPVRKGVEGELPLVSDQIDSIVGGLKLTDVGVDGGHKRLFLRGAEVVLVGVPQLPGQVQPPCGGDGVVVLGDAGASRMGIGHVDGLVLKHLRHAAGMELPAPGPLLLHRGQRPGQRSQDLLRGAAEDLGGRLVVPAPDHQADRPQIPGIREEHAGGGQAGKAPLQRVELKGRPADQRLVDDGVIEIRQLTEGGLIGPEVRRFF